jgi:hypothetical protein
MVIETVWRPIGRATWWIAAPIAFLGWLLAARPSVIDVSDEPFSIEANTLHTTHHPLVGELLAAYRITAVALTLLAAITLYSHVHRTHAVRTLTLMLPVYVAAFEACRHFTWFGTRHSLTCAPTLGELHRQFHMAASASIVAVAATLIVAAAVAKWCRGGLAGAISWRSVFGIAPLASVVILWWSTDRIFFGPPPRLPMVARRSHFTLPSNVRPGSPTCSVFKDLSPSSPFSSPSSARPQSRKIAAAEGQTSKTSLATSSRRSDAAASPSPAAHPRKALDRPLREHRPMSKPSSPR